MLSSPRQRFRVQAAIAAPLPRFSLGTEQPVPDESALIVIVLEAGGCPPRPGWVRARPASAAVRHRLPEHEGQRSV